MSDDSFVYLCPGEVVCFDGDGDGDGAKDSPNDGEGAGGDGSNKGAAGSVGGENPARTFSQEDVNRIVEERLTRDRKKNEEKYRDLESRYATLLDNQNLTEEERSKLEENLEDVRKRLRTKEEEAKHQMKHVQKQFETQLAEATQAAEQWKTRFHEAGKQRALQDAAVAQDAYNPSQVVSLLKPMTKHRAKVDEATGKETDVFETVVDFLDRDDDGAEVVTQRTPEETVKRMKQLPEYANLFKSNVVSGVGANNATGGMTPGANGRVDVRKLTPEQYKKIRKENPELLGLDPKRLR